jgi:hypothetical protein
VFSLPWQYTTFRDVVIEVTMAAVLAGLGLQDLLTKPTTVCDIEDYVEPE